MGSKARFLGYFLGLMVALTGGLALSEHLFKVQYPLDSLIFPGARLQNASPLVGRPSFLTALNFFFYGLAMASLDFRPQRGRWRLDFLIVMPFIITLLAVIGFFCGVPSFYGRISLFPNTAMSLPTVMAFAILGMGLLYARQEEGLSELIVSRSAGGLIARRLLLAPVLIPLSTGLGTLAFQKFGYFNTEFAGWLISFCNIFIFTLVIWWIATLLKRESENRDAAEQSVRRANAELENRVLERTAELQQSVEKVQWLASFPERNPNPIIEVSLTDGSVHYLNSFAAQLFPDLEKLGLQHPWLQGLQDYLQQLSNGSSETIRREIMLGDRCFAQSISYTAARQSIRVYATEITERVRAEEALTQERNLLRALIDHLPACIYVKDLEGRFLVYNAASVQLTGVGSEAAAVGKTVSDLFPAEIARLYEEDDARVMASGQPIFDREEPTQDAQKENRWFLTTKIPLRNNDAAIIGLLGISQDITSRKQAEQLIHDAVEREQELRLQAQQSEDRFRTLVERSLVGIYVIQDDKFAYVNPAMEKNLGYSAAELASMKVLDTVAPEDRPLFQENLRRRIQGLLPETRYGLRLLRRNGSIAFVEVRGSLSEFNGRSAILGTLLDVTERKEAEQKIQQLNEQLEARVLQRTVQLEEANKELEAFSYSVSHDLRAPLRHIHGYGEMLKREIEGRVSGEAQRFLDVIGRASAEMGQLIDDLLAFSRIARVEMQQRKVDLPSLVQRTIHGLEMDTKGREIAWTVAPLPAVWGDTPSLRQVFANLLGNAVKYTRHCESAQIEIGCHSDEGDYRTFYIKDNGAGFDMQYADKLFGVFQRLHGAEEFEGTGIGLATVRRIIQRHGGRTWAEGVVNGGATFFFTLKAFENSESSTPDAKAQANPAGR